jgi:hypothetical protein
MKTTEFPPAPPEYHEDPLTGEPGSHPVGTGVGATLGGAALGLVGATAGPVGAVVGVTVGAILGGLSGKGFAEGLDPTSEEAYWREHHKKQSFAGDDDYEIYARGYRTGYEGYRPGQSFEEREADLRMEYEGGPQKPRLEDEEAGAAKAARAAQRAETMEENMSSRPAEEQQAASTEDDLRSRPLEWVRAREASKAAYEKVQRALEERMKTMPMPPVP